MLTRDSERLRAERLEAGVASASVDTPLVIRAVDLTKTFRLPHQRHTTVKERLRHAITPVEYEELVALRGVTLEVRRGEFLGIVGRNGSGKSTLLRCIAGIYVPDGGTIEIYGRLASFIDLGVGFNPELPARENAIQNAVLFGLEPREAAARFDEMLAFAELERFVDQDLKNYSSGMSARLAFAVMTHVDADVLLFDEVLSVGDAAFRQKCLDHFDRLRSEGRTIVLVTHDTGTVERSCDRAALIDAGCILETGAPEAVLARYQELTAAAQARPASLRPLPRPVPSRQPRLRQLLGRVRRMRTVRWAEVVTRLLARALRTLVRPAFPPVRPGIAPSLGRSSMLGPDPRRFVVLTRMLAATDFRLKYSSAIFGYAWAIAHPAALFGILLLVFGELGRFNRNIPHYAAYLMLAIVLWTFFAQTTAASLASLKRRAGLVRKLPFPRLAVPFASALGAAFDLAVNLIVVFVFVLATGVPPRLSWLELPLLVFVLVLLAAGVGVLLSALYVRHRDLDQLWSLTSRVLFYSTPIFYVATMVPTPVRAPLLLLNPLAAVFTEARHAVIDPTAPSAADVAGGYPMLLVPLGVVLGMLLLGLWAFARESPRAPEYV